MPLTHEMRERILRNETVRAWISKRAYELHQLGGNEYGKATQDWLNAESELLALASLLEEIFCSAASHQRTTKSENITQESTPSNRLNKRITQRSAADH